MAMKAAVVDEAKVPLVPHTLDIQAVAALLNVRPETGLSAQEARERLSRVGRNCLPQAPARPPWRVLLAQFKSILILILLGAVVLAAMVGSTKDALVILAVVVINALVGFYQEYRAERSLAALKSMLPGKARVRRDGVVCPGKPRDRKAVAVERQQDVISIRQRDFCSGVPLIFSIRDDRPGVHPRLSVVANQDHLLPKAPRCEVRNVTVPARPTGHNLI